MARKALEPNLWTMGDTFRHMYFVPVYQRPYSWELPQINVILDDIFGAYKLPENEREEGYFIGSIYIHDTNEKLKGLIQKYEIIDGQQRLTTISLLLLSIYSYAFRYQIPDNEQTLIEVKKSLWKYVDRSYDKQNRAVTLNSIEKKCFEDLYNSCFDRPGDILDYCGQYDVKNRFEGRVIDNFKAIDTRVGKEFPEERSEELLDFADFLLNYVQVIAIDSTCSISKAFSIFESINSKGKPLNEIDKIKTYIFSELDEASYDYYLNLWGNLIIETEDQLYDYLYNYIKAYISFYRNNILVDRFKSLSRNELLVYFKKRSVPEALKALLDDMYRKVKFYNMLCDADKAYALVKNNEFRFYYTVFVQINYKHPKPLFLRCIEEYASEKMSKEDLVCTVRETVKFMFEFLTIGDRDSKDAITMFSTIMNDIYKRLCVDRSVVVQVIAGEMISRAITPDRIKAELTNMDAFDQNRRAAVALLALYESTNIDAEGNARISYDKAYTLLHDYGQTFSLDHLLVQTPKPDSEFSYYRDGDGKLVLKEGHDFEPGAVVSGMEYDQFTRAVLNRLGNLRLWYKDENSARRNDVIRLNEYAGFVTYEKVRKRGEQIINTLIDKCLPMPDFDPNVRITPELKENALPKMDKLIEYGLLRPGDRLRITIDPEHSEAVLLDGSYVEFRGEKIKINDWGCRVTGWKSVNIYTIASRVGEDETLQQKRQKYVIDQNEEALS